MNNFIKEYWKWILLIIGIVAIGILIKGYIFNWDWMCIITGKCVIIKK